MTVDALDVASDEFLENPYPQLARLREQQPLHRARSGAWVLTRHADVAAALADKRLGNTPAPWATVNARNRHKYLCAEVANNTLPFMDGDRHRKLRMLLARGWTEQLREHPPEIANTAHGILGQVGVEFDLLADFATPLAVRVICDIVGIPEQHRPACHAELQWFFYLFTGIPDRETLKRVDEGLGRLRELIGRVIDASVVDGSLIERLVEQGAVDAVGREVLIDNIALLLADGVENVDSGIANAVISLMDHRDQWEQVCADPELAEPAALEALRYESPATFITRIVQEDLAWNDQELRAGEAVLLMLASCNRDPDRFEAPDAFNIHRTDLQNLSFGKGHHSCVGASLARHETAEALRALATSRPGVRCTGAKLHWRRRVAHRWLESLPVHSGSK